MNSVRYLLKMRFREESYPDLHDISSLLYDLELSHDYGVYLSEKEYWNYEFSRYLWYRNGRPIKPHYRVKAHRIVKESPLELTLVIASVGALWIVLKIIEKIVNWPLNRKKLKLEVERLELEVAEKRAAKFHRTIEFVQEQRTSRVGSAIVEEKLVKRLAESKLALLDIEVGLLEEDPEDSTSRKG